jgi:hypothetical protein
MVSAAKKETFSLKDFILNQSLGMVVWPVFCVMLMIGVPEILCSYANATEIPHNLVYHNQKVEEFRIPLLTSLTGYTEVKFKDGLHDIIPKS